MNKFEWSKVILTVVLMAPICRSAQSQSIPFKHFTSEDGLPSQCIYEVYQDKKGFMWFATSAGVSKFDGNTFQNYTEEYGIPDNEIFGFYEDSLGRLWLRSMNGKISFIKNDLVYSSVNTPLLKSLDQKTIIQSIFEAADGSVIITYYGQGVIQYTKSGTSRWLYNKVDSISGSFISTYQNEAGNYIVIRSRAIVEVSPIGAEITKIPLTFTTLVNRYTGKGQWIATQDRLTYTFGGYDSLSWLKTGSLILKICAGNKNRSIWACTQKGAYQIQEENIKLEKPFLPSYEISSVLEDKEGNIWFTTLSDGVILASSPFITMIGKADGLYSDKIHSLNLDIDNNILIGHDNLTYSKIDKSGVISLHKISDETYSYLSSHTPVIYKILNNTSDIIAITQRDLYHKRNGRLVIIEGLNGKEILELDSGKFLIAARKKGVVIYNSNLLLKHPGKMERIKYSPNLKCLRRVSDAEANCLFKNRDGEIMVGLEDGLAVFRNDSLINLNDKYQKLNTRILDIQVDSAGTQFFCTGKGLFIVKKNGTIFHLTKGNGLTSNQCHRILINKSIVWLGTNMGVTRIALSKEYKPLRIDVLNSSYGLMSNEVTSLLLKDEKLWIGTLKGLSVYPLKYEVQESISPPIYITNANTHKRKLDLDGHAELNYFENNIQLDYIGLSYKRNNLNYAYQLVNNDQSHDTSAWIITKNNSVDFSSLEPGKYTFMVKAQGTPAESWGGTAIYNFTIKSPFWKTMPFLLSLITSSGIASFYIARYGLLLKRRKDNLKRRIHLTELKSLRSKLNYHFISNSFNSLLGLILSEKDIDQYLGKFSKLMRWTLERIDKPVVLLYEELEYLRLYCDIEALRVNNAFSFIIEIDDSIKKNKLLLPPLTLHPFIENAIWHGLMPVGGGTITLSVKPGDKFTFVIIIEDNGIGINSSLEKKSGNARKSFGTSLVINHLKLIHEKHNEGVQLKIEDRSEISNLSGTKISITFPYVYESNHY